jgi:uncharacterized phage protein gp47/JayE
MPFARPTRTALIQAALADLAQSLGLTAVLRFRPEFAMGTAFAGLVNGLYGYLDWIAKQAVPATSTGEFRAAWAALKGVFPKEETYATGTGTWLGTSGFVLPTGTALSLVDGSAAYVTTADATVGDHGTVSAPITATTAGALANVAGGTALVISGSVPGVTSAGVADGPITGGAPAEDVDSDGFLTRMLLAYAEPAQGGAAGDYLDWALAVPGVTRAWVTPNGMGAGSVVVRFMMDEAQAANGGFPQGSDGVAAAETRAAPATGDQLAVANAIFPVRPVTALVYAVAPSAEPIDFVISDLAENTASNRAAVEAALAKMLKDLGEPGGTIYPNQTNAAIDAVPGVTRFTLVSPTAPVSVAAGALPTLGNVAFS